MSHNLGKNEKPRSIDTKKCFGGELLKGKRKSLRPLSKGKPLHLVLKSSKAFGRRSLLHPHNRKLLKKYTRRFVRRFDIVLMEFANVGNHIHIVIKSPHRKAYTSFISALTGTISKMIFRAPGMWDYRPFTRIATWGRDARALERYVVKNIEQGLMVVMINMRKEKNWRESAFKHVLWSR